MAFGMSEKSQFTITIIHMVGENQGLAVNYLLFMSNCVQNKSHLLHGQ